MTNAPTPHATRQRLLALARASGDVPAVPADLEAAAAELLRGGPASDEAALATLRAAVSARLAAGDRQDVEAVFAAAMEAVAELTGRAPAIPAIQAVADQVAAALELDPGEAKAWRQKLVATERGRRGAARQAKERAREIQQAEERRLAEWEGELVGPEALPALLGVPRRLVERWIDEGLIPVARTTAVRRGGRVTEDLEFHPDQVAVLLPRVAEWTARTAAPEAEAGRARISNGTIARRAGLDRYAAHFAEARAMDRRITVVIGPTNSGKSHYALDRLAAAASGAALAPLRLLALEFQDALAARGVLANLVTGEERQVFPGARHVACTVEMAHTSREVDVAVIDEAQMLADPDRGAAWTAAIMGIPAREVIVLGAPDCLPLVRRIAELCGEPVEVVRLERKSPLRVADEPVNLASVTAADAVVAFSRREIFALREQLVAKGRTVAVIYGALGPEVRRTESRRFRENEAPVLVATDAIGMGLNLPIRRVVFSALVKWDGRQERSLTSAEVRQIGGRAGRFGQHEEGIVAVLAGGGEPARLRALMDTEPAAPADLRPQVSPDRRIVAAVAEELGTASLLETLRRIRGAVLRPNDPNYRLADLDTQMEIAAVLDGAELPLLERWTYALCPVDVRDAGIDRLLRWGLEHAAGERVPVPTAGHLPAPQRADQAALERAEKVSKRLVAWRWLSQHFPDSYADAELAGAERRRLDRFIETVLRQQAIGRSHRGGGPRGGPRGGPQGGGPQRGGDQRGGGQKAGGQNVGVQKAGGQKGGPPPAKVPGRPAGGGKGRRRRP